MPRFLDEARAVSIRLAKRVLWKAMRVPVMRKAARLIAEESAQFAHFDAVSAVGNQLNSALGLTVRRGPFTGMIYPGHLAVGSTLYPKLLGSYERELQPAIDSAIARGYRTVVDIGAAEGYYAVGFARALPDARVIAFEANPAGCDAVREMAAANDVAGRVSVFGAASVETLEQLRVDQPVLLVSDCEGCEHSLLDPNRVHWLRQADLIIEVHQLHGIEPRSELAERLRGTHDVETVEVRQRDSSLYPELEALPPRHREAILFERTDLNGWMVFRARTRT